MKIPWWLWIIILTVISKIAYELAKRSGVGWIIKLAETAVYISEQFGKMNGLSGEQKLQYALEIVRKLSKDLKVDWITKWIPDEVIKSFIESIVGKTNWQIKNNVLNEIKDKNNADKMIQNAIEKYNDLKGTPSIIKPEIK